MEYNDKSIFKYLDYNSNEMLSRMDNDSLNEIMGLINRYYLEYRDLLGIDNNVTFGLEIEMEHFKGSVYDFWPFETNIYKIVGNENWVVKNDITLDWGRELATEIYSDDIKTWVDMKNVCQYISMYGDIGMKSAGHINIGSQIFGDNSLYWYRFLKMWCVYENIIYRFGYGEYLDYFPYMLNSAKPLSKTIYDKLDIFKSKIDIGSKELLYELKDRDMNVDFLKKNAVSFIKMYENNNLDLFQEGSVVEIRNCLGTLNEIIWQNNVNFFVKLMLYCKSINFNEDILDRRIYDNGIIFDINEYNKIYLEQGLELCDLIFDNNMDKVYFLRQYLKNNDVCNKKYVKARNMTINK